MESIGEQERFCTPDINLPTNRVVSPNSKEKYGSSGSARRMKRAAVQTPPNDEELLTFQKSNSTSGKSRRGKIQKTLTTEENSHSAEDAKIQPKISAKNRAEEFRVGLGTEFPSFWKVLPRTSVMAGFCLALPSRFYKSCMPNADTTISLEDTNGDHFTATYIAERGHVSGGWKRFSAVHELCEGDIVIFQLLKPLHFKVFIFKESDTSPMDETPASSSDSEMNKKENSEIGRPIEMVCAQNMMLITPSETGDQSAGNGVVEGEKRQNTVKLENFHIVVRESVIDGELSEEQRAKYYELCLKQNACLHENLLESISSKLAAEMILGILNIYESMKATKVLGSGETYAVWDRTLKGFELLGMNVEFLRARLSGLIRLAREAEEAIEMESMAIRLEQARISEEISALRAKLVEMEDLKRKLCGQMEALRANAESVEAQFNKLRDSPW